MQHGESTCISYETCHGLHMEVDSDFTNGKVYKREFGYNGRSVKERFLTFATPGEISGVETHGAELHVASTASDGVDTLGSDLSHSRRTSHHKFSLLANRFALSTGVAALVHGVTRDTCRRREVRK